MNKDQYVLSEKMLDVGSGHALYVQEWGNPKASVPIIFLHGGPGGQVKNKHKGAFDPESQRVIFFDQRGCGKSTPYGSLKNNTTDELIEDISKIADEYKAKIFILHGSSWGSTLALAYALKYPERVGALVIGGVFTGSKNESEWIDNGHFQSFFPDVWQAYLDRTPVKHQNDPSKYHFDKVVSGTAEEQKASAYAYDCLESGVVQLDNRHEPEDFETYDPASMRIEMHYLAKGCFMPDRYILENAYKLTMPVYIVQGRYDMVCPPHTAYELRLSLPNSQLYWTLSGHKHEHEGENIFRSIFASLQVEA
jgi:proline iminopeptidase